MLVKISTIILFILLIDKGFAQERSDPLIIDHTCENLLQIPSNWINIVQDNIRWHYAHTSHGEQLLEGLKHIELSNPDYSFARGSSYLPTETGALCIFDGQEDDNWIDQEEYWMIKSGMNKTRSVLDNNPTLKVSQWSWCRSLNTYSEAQTQAYLDSISALEAEYPNVNFVYMTGNAQATGSEGYNRFLRNEQIRNYCQSNNKILYDFADLDAWWFNPATEEWEQNTYEYDGHTIPVEHTQFNGEEIWHTNIESCEQKGRSVWWMMARIAGWQPSSSNESPVMGMIPSQIIPEGGTFVPINLDDYVDDPDNTDEEINWTSSLTNHVTVSITNRVAEITLNDPEWNGSETVTFTAVDPGGLADDDTVTFTVTPVNDAPVVSDIPDQSIVESDSFSSISLDEYVHDPDNVDEDIIWSASVTNNIAVSIIERIATITITNLNWYGSETVTFTAHDPDGLSSSDQVKFELKPTAIYSESNRWLPEESKLFPAYPNPFNSSTIISYYLGDDSDVNIEIYSLSGDKIITLHNNWESSGLKRIKWNGKDYNGTDVCSGIYFCKIYANFLNGKVFSETRKLILLK